MAETLTVASTVVSDIEPETCIKCSKNVVQGVIEFVERQTAKSELTPAQCADLVLESLRRCREHNNCPRTDENAFTARPC